MLKYIISGFSQGFPLHFQGQRQFCTPKNLPSALQNPKYVDKKLAQELAANRIAGPFTSPPIHSFCVSLLGLIPKKIPGDFRLIHHLSFPKGISNTDAIKLIKRAGPGCYLAKTDIKSAFRIIPIHPNDFRLLGMKWCGLYYNDRCMPMGCKTFETFSTALEWIARHKVEVDELLFIRRFSFCVYYIYSVSNQFNPFYVSMQPTWHPYSTRQNFWTVQYSNLCRYRIRHD